MKIAVVAAMKWTAFNLLLLLCLAQSLNATEMPKQLAARVRFMENVDMWGSKDAIDRDRFLQAFYWSASEFDMAGAADIRIIVVHCDKETGKFSDIGPYPAAIRYPAEAKSKLPYEVWFVGKVTDAMMIVAFMNVYAHALNMDKKQSSLLGQKAFEHLQSTVSVKELERK